MAAAQRIGEEYELKINKAPQNADGVLTQGSEMMRVRELIHWNLDNTACGEWVNLVKSKLKTKQAQLARYVFNNQWWDLNIRATIAGKLWDHLGERLLPAYSDLLKCYTSGKETPQSYAVAVAHQESAWNPGVKPPVGVSSLMQIMPSATTHTAKMFSIPGYSNPG